MAKWSLNFWRGCKTSGRNFPPAVNDHSRSHNSILASQTRSFNGRHNIHVAHTHTKAGATTNKLCERGGQTLRMFGERGQCGVQCSRWTAETSLLITTRTFTFNGRQNWSFSHKPSLQDEPNMDIWTDWRTDARFSLITNAALVNLDVKIQTFCKSTVALGV